MSSGPGKIRGDSGHSRVRSGVAVLEGDEISNISSPDKHGLCVGIEGVELIGHIVFDHEGRPTEARLGSDGLWVCEQSPSMAARLNTDFSPIGQKAGPSWGYPSLIRAARQFGGIAWLGEGGSKGATEGPPPTRP